MSGGTGSFSTSTRRPRNQNGRQSKRVLIGRQVPSPRVYPWRVRLVSRRGSSSACYAAILMRHKLICRDEHAFHDGNVRHILCYPLFETIMLSSSHSPMRCTSTASQHRRPRRGASRGIDKPHGRDVNRNSRGRKEAEKPHSGESQWRKWPYVVWSAVRYVVVWSAKPKCPRVS